MKHSFWMRFRATRSVIIFFVVLLYVVLAFADAEQTFSHSSAFNTLALPIWLSFGFSLSIALIFLAVGSLIWFYSRDRRVAFLLFTFSCTIMVAFELETSASIGLPDTRLASTVSDIASSIAIFLFAVILLVFPKNHIVSMTSSVYERWLQTLWLSVRSSPIRWYIFSLMLFLCFGLVDSISTFVLYPQLPPGWLDTIGSVAIIFALTGSLITIIASFRKSTTREREQLRFFVSGVVLSLAPLLLLTAIPQTVAILTPYAIDSQITTLTIILLPLSLGYAILRYQILVFDSYIRRTVNWIIGTIFLAMLVYVVTLVGSRLWGANIPFYVVMIAITMAVLAPAIWWSAKILTERVLFKELLRYRRLIDEPITMGSEVFDLESTAQLITVAALQTFKTTQVGLFVLIEDTGCYHVFPSLADTQNDTRRMLASRLSSSLTTSLTGIDALALLPSVEKRLSASRRPLLLHEVTRAEEDMPTGLSRYLTSSTAYEQNDPLIAPVRSQGKMIALLVLGERADKQSYAGPDFEIVELLLARFSSLLETARLQEHSRQHAALLNDLYKTGAIAAEELSDLEHVASAFAKIAADAMHGGVEICLYDKKEKVLQQTTIAGIGSRLLVSTKIQLTPADWSAYYYAGQGNYPQNEGSTETPPCIQQKPSFPFAWLPLSKGEKHLGILILTYRRSHLFFNEEMHVLEMFAAQCASVLENTRITIELRAAYERQKELDVLKDQFIMTASHELRTPLTAVLGYIELLEEYNLTLDANMRGDFIAKAHRGCDELTLMVNNIMDANRVQADVDSTKIGSVSLKDSVVHIVEIIEAISRREQRTISLAIPATLFVLADGIRLRQVLLNLVSNALKYSPAGTDIEISAETDNDYVTACVRDYGSGVPPEEQNRLFERFVRLERDMNSPIRGAGLGLYICRQLVEAMGGTIWIESTGQEGEGSSFFFTLRSAPLAVDAGPLEYHNLSTTLM